MDLEIYVTLSLIFLVIVVYIFHLLKAKFKKESEKNKDRISLYKRRVDSLIKLKEDDEKFSKLDEIAKAFFKEFFGFDYNTGYSEIVRKLGKNQKKEKDFCEKAEKLNYGKEEITEEKLENLIRLFKSIVEEKSKEILNKK